MTLRAEPSNEYKCFRTLHVFDGKTMVGAVQCKGPCFGIDVAPGHQHGPWVAFVGPSKYEAQNLAGTYPDIDAAIAAIEEEIHG